MSERWDRHFLDLAQSRMSKDPSTRVGSIIVGPEREGPLCGGFNGLPRGIADTPERLNDRETKLKLIVHAEENALLTAARLGIRLLGCTLYLAATDDSGLVWGGAPCLRCSCRVIQAGIREVVSYPFKNVPSRWAADVAEARLLLDEAGVIYREVTP